MARLEKLSIIVFSGSFDHVHYALATASAAAATNIAVTLFFTMGAIRALTNDDKGESRWGELMHSESTDDGTTCDSIHKTSGVASFEELLEACVALKVKFLVCEMGLRAAGFGVDTLRDDVPIEQGGLVTFLADANANGSMLFI
jgi:peroxiredoxin family protein